MIGARPDLDVYRLSLKSRGWFLEFNGLVRVGGVNGFGAEPGDEGKP